jgi:hypothetical protein
MKPKEIAMYILGGLITVGFFLTLIFLIVSGKYESTLQLVVGSLIAAFGTVVGYYYGSSKGSADKNDLLQAKPDAP